MPQSQQQTREGSHVSHYQGKVTAYPMTHRSLWPVTTIHRHQPRIIMFNSFYLGPKSNSRGESGRFFTYFFIIFFFFPINYFCVLNTWFRAAALSYHYYMSLSCLLFLFRYLFFCVALFWCVCRFHCKGIRFCLFFFSPPLVLFWTQRKTRNNQPLNLRHIHVTYNPLYRAANTPFELFCKLMNHTASAQALQHGVY